jgi:hypothetical protein
MPFDYEVQREAGASEAGLEIPQEKAKKPMVFDLPKHNTMGRHGLLSLLFFIAALEKGFNCVTGKGERERPNLQAVDICVVLRIIRSIQTIQINKIKKLLTKT